MAVKITIVKNQDGCITEMTMTGHTGYAETGRDIVCAAVSALIQTAVLQMEKIYGKNNFYRLDKGFAHFSVPADFPDAYREKIYFLLEALYGGLAEIKRHYGKHIKLEEVFQSKKKNKA